MVAPRGSHLVIDVKELRDRPGTQQHLTRTVGVPAEFSTVLVGFRQGEDLELDLRLESVHEGVLMTGTASAQVAGQCGRCLDELGYPLTVDVMQLFTFPERAAQASGEAEDEDERLIGDDLTIDLEPVLRDLMVSALPFQPVCREECPGLCSQCGFRMEDDPEHFHEQIDPRWAALANLRNGLDEPED
ncbi:YceD family protein [Nesterenkonia sp. PF2B19]|uniref:YceD family protein n=1 Tax=Nesterenkonia sp. PF2B19 TaxID=1881858 RepID=UPI000A6766AA|nr:YceD family protein [Nesterenkonia sp. PF2B19]